MKESFVSSFRLFYLFVVRVDGFVEGLVEGRRRSLVLKSTKLCALQHLSIVKR
jgi:hypothetical protein